MPKKRKTLKQKLSTDKKSYVVSETTHSDESSHHHTTQPAQQDTGAQGVTFSLPEHYASAHHAQKEKKPEVATIAVSTDDYGYLRVDLIKTAVLSSVIVLTEIVIKILFRV